MLGKPHALRVLRICRCFKSRPRANGRRPTAATALNPPLAERLIFWFLSRRRRVEFLEPLLATAFRSPDVFAKRHTNLKPAMMAKFDEMSDVGPMYFERKDGAEELYELFLWLRSLADQVVQRHSTAEWLLLVRRTFLAPLDAVAMPPAWFVEAFLRRARMPTLNSRLVKRSFRVSPRTLEDVHDLLMTTTAMWHVGQGFRSVSKGSIVTIVDPITYFGVGVPVDQAVHAAISLFDARRARWHGTGLGNPLSSPGVYGRRFAAEGGEHRHGGALCSWFEHGSERDRDRYFLRWRTHYFPEFIDPDSVFGLGTGQSPNTRGLAAAGALWACWKDAGLHSMKFRVPNGTWNLWGLQEIRIGALRDGLREWAQLASRYDSEWDPDVALAELERSSSELEWIDADYALVCPFTEETVLVDLVGTSRALNEAHVRESGGDAANQWTSLFERQVQEVIDSTPWRPDGEFRELIGRTIRLDGRDLTDIDAVAERDGTLMLVDAKAWATPSTLEFGEFWAVRSRARTAEDASVAWQGKMETIRQNLHVLGMTSTPAIVGLVVAPEAPYVPAGPCTQEVVGGLLAVSSLAELEFCLGSGAGGDGCTHPEDYRPEVRRGWPGLLDLFRRMPNRMDLVHAQTLPTRFKDYIGRCRHQTYRPHA